MEEEGAAKCRGSRAFWQQSDQQHQVSPRVAAGMRTKKEAEDVASEVISDIQWVMVVAAVPVRFSKRQTPRWRDRGRSSGKRKREQGESLDQDAGLTPARGGRRGRSGGSASDCHACGGRGRGDGDAPRSEGGWPRHSGGAATGCQRPRPRPGSPEEDPRCISTAP